MLAALIAPLVACDVAERTTAHSVDRSAKLQLSTLGSPTTYKIGKYAWVMWRDSSVLVVKSRAASADQALAAHAAAAGGGALNKRVLNARSGTWRLDIGSWSPGAWNSLRQRLEADTQVTFVAAAYRDSAGAEILPSGQMMVRFKAGTSSAQIDSLRKAANLGLIAASDPSRATYEYMLAYPRGTKDPFAAAEAIGQAVIVEFAEPDRSSGLTLHYVPTDPFFSQQYYLQNSVVLNSVPVDIAVKRVWDFTTGYRLYGVHVAVLDDGIQGWHADFANVTAGFDAVGDCNACAYDPQPPGNGFSHGTAVAGIVGASHSNGIGIAGVAPSAILVPVRIYDNLGNTTDVSILVLAINWSWDLGQADVINASWSCCLGGSPSLDAAIANAVTWGRSGRGTVVVFSAGNFASAFRQSGTPRPVAYPASNANVISVSAIDQYGVPAQYAPRGKVDLVAPSSPVVDPCTGDVVTLDRMGAPGCNDGPGGSLDYTSTFGGTSAAAPQVAGVAALLISREPTLTVTQIRQRLAAGADPWGRADDFGAGKLNATFTVLPLTATLTGPTSITTAGTYTWAATPSGGDGVYFYSWAYQNWGQSTWIGVSGGATVSRTISASTSRFRWRLTVFSSNRTVVQYLDVSVDLGGCSPFC